MNQEYYDHVNPDLLRFIPLNAVEILEVGCGTGALGEQYKKKNPHARYRGLEIHSDIAVYAVNRLDEVLVGNVEEIDLLSKGIALESLDCLIYGDVLEHLIDPWNVLADHVRYLKSGGQVIACIPNIQHWSIIKRILCGTWNYEPAGLLDRTHLRFFALDQMRDLFVKAGLNVFNFQVRGRESQDYQQLQ